MKYTKKNIKKLIIKNIVQLRNDFKKRGGEKRSEKHPKRKPKSATKSN